MQRRCREDQGPNPRNALSKTWRAVEAAGRIDEQFPRDADTSVAPTL